MASDNNTGVLVALIGIAAAFVFLVAGRGSASAPTVSTGATTREDVVQGFQPSEDLLDELRSVASGSSGSSSGGAGGAELSPDTAPGSAGFTQAIIERTGYLPDGFDAAGRISQINRLEDGQAVGL